MKPLLDDGDAPILVLPTSPVSHELDFLDGFRRADSATLGLSWVDLSDTQAAFDPLAIKDEAFSRIPNPPRGAGLAHRESDLDDGFRIVMAFNGFEDVLTALNQVGPAIFVDPAVAADDRYLALTLVTDFTIIGLDSNSAQSGIVGFNNVANMTMEDFNDGYATESWYWDANFIPTSGDGLQSAILLEVRVVGGEMAGYVNGARIIGPVPVPAEFAGRTRHGISARVEDTILGGERVCLWYGIGPWSTPLPAYADAVTVAYGTGVKAAAAASIDLTYPAMAAGRQIYAAIVNSNGGSITVPSGWVEINSTAITASVRTHVLRRRAVSTGSDSGTVNFAKSSGTGNLGGLIFSTANENPKGLMAGTGSANTGSSTDIAQPDAVVLGKNRTLVSVIACGGNVALSEPTGFTPGAQLGTGDATAVNLSIGTRVETQVPHPQGGLPVTGAQRGTAGTSIGQIFWTYPDPTE